MSKARHDTTKAVIVAILPSPAAAEQECELRRLRRQTADVHHALQGRDHRPEEEPTPGGHEVDDTEEGEDDRQHGRQAAEVRHREPHASDDPAHTAKRISSRTCITPLAPLVIPTLAAATARSMPRSWR